MRKRVLVVLAALTLAFAVPPSAMAAPKTTVKLGDNFFKPTRKTIRRGTKVRFRWIGDNPHNVTKTRGPGGRFKSRTTSSDGVNFAKKFKQPGTYKLICTIHPSEMRLTLKVR